MKTAKPIFDELDILRERLNADFSLGTEQRKLFRDDRIDEILDMLIMAYVFGTEDADEELTVTEEVVTDEMYNAVWLEIAGRNWEQRVREYFDDPNGTVDDIMRVVETDTNRIYSDAVLNVGEKVSKRGESVTKTWETMLDDKVRWRHELLQSVTVPINERFHVDGDSARYPGDFQSSELNCNCRCYITLNRAQRYKSERNDYKHSQRRDNAE